MLAPVVNSGALIPASDATLASANWHAKLALLPLVAGDEVTEAFPGATGSRR
ncbi:hypothetical protein [Gemmata sp. SH-PL17]|uniref:hypothetical protein n=1 Tax=Gemmata sp. SH-PL17 TaxID=1630693 RepID=UPI0004B05C89|nr:hypothetical protein [Gemmata sp. SH-PL17]